MNLKIILFYLVKLPILHLSMLKEGQLFDLEFAPDHFVDDADVGLDDFHYFGNLRFRLRSRGRGFRVGRRGRVLQQCQLLGGATFRRCRR